MLCLQSKQRRIKKNDCTVFTKAIVAIQRNYIKSACEDTTKTISLLKLIDQSIKLTIKTKDKNNHIVVFSFSFSFLSSFNERLFLFHPLRSFFCFRPPLNDLFLDADNRLIISFQ
ncbi:hypothetical protein BpHYR1_027791 [Brachionus plicatilis]|uniref:Uncharacterized protein n=1 Tax=Brachionus plicatilis TaxID=10195 RepID=A0A3M7RUL1_BRAPC|nr:hypothetical protein BpHYR1_027791 [Brachionus plicatilis]